jgi:hypothetical protein
MDRLETKGVMDSQDSGTQLREWSRSRGRSRSRSALESSRRSDRSDQYLSWLNYCKVVVATLKYLEYLGDDQ